MTLPPAPSRFPLPLLLLLLLAAAAVHADSWRAGSNGATRPVPIPDYPALLKVASRDNPDGVKGAFTIGSDDSVSLTLHVMNNGARTLFRIGTYGSIRSRSLPTTLSVAPGSEVSLTFNAIAQVCPRDFLEIYLTRPIDDTTDQLGSARIRVDSKCPDPTGLGRPFPSGRSGYRYGVPEATRFSVSGRQLMRL